MTSHTVIQKAIAAVGPNPQGIATVRGFALTASHRVLLIDNDMKEVHALLQQILMDDPNLPVESAHTAEEAIYYIQIYEYDLIVCDFKLPGISGLSFLKLAKEIQPKVPVIVISGYTKRTLKQQALRLGAWAFLPKPLNFRTLRHTIRKALAYQSIREAVAY